MKREMLGSGNSGIIKGKTLIRHYHKKRGMKPTPHGIAIVVSAFRGHCLLHKKRGLFSMSVMQPFPISQYARFYFGLCKISETLL